MWGLFAQLWLLSDTDSKGLLPSSHPALVLIWGLTLVVLISLFFVSHSCHSRECSLQSVPFLPAIGNLCGAIGICITSVAQLQQTADFLSRLTGFLGFLTAAAMLMMLVPQLQKQKFFLYLLLCLYTMAHTICQYRQWSTCAQLMRYAFPLFGSVLVMIYSYYRACVYLNLPKCRQMIFFNQAAFFCCCLAIPASNCHMLYLAAAIWLVCDLYASGKPEGDTDHANS